MTPQRWIVAGWSLLAAAAVLAVIAIAQTVDSVNGTPVPLTTATPSPGILLGDGRAEEFLRGLICAVFSGVAFFSALACFFWSALQRSRQDLTRLLESLNPKRQPRVRGGLIRF